LITKYGSSGNLLDGRETSARIKFISVARSAKLKSGNIPSRVIPGVLWINI
jgi:hypothetical protein